MGSMDLRAESRQTQTLSPRLQHAVRLLQMSSLDFAAMVRDKMGQNPFLEPEEGEDGEAATDSGEADTAAEGAPSEAEAADVTSIDPGDDREIWQGEGPGGTRRAEDGEISALDMMAVETTLNMHLHEQLNVLPLEPRDRALAQAIVESLDDDGYLRTPLDEVAEVLNLEPPPSPTELSIALKRVQSLDPAGVAARSVAECLQLQLSKIDCAASRALAERIVSRHLHTLAAKDVNGLAHQLGETPARIEEVCDRIRRLDPRPGWRFGSSQVAYVVPDVLVKRVRGQWSVQLNPAVVPRVRFNHVYAELFQRHRSTHNGEMAGHLQDARWTLRNVEQRFSTILDVAQAIVRRQRHFLEYGPMAMKPLVLREIADEVGIHESTVSRVTNNKYMATPIGVFELKYFFSRAMISANGSACSATAIRGLIKDIIEAERPERPLSDAEITRQLAQQGLVVARRTVTKYRQMLRIESVERRRRHS
ncbi:RNA polymerase factor sigma-54 [Rubrivivax gelatinosus]|uniref:RNA polymerase sigma-54 factor n=1 Tax=Rubrivivax gelatinosus TaxID=28068 RepID=A0A4R2MGI5_RUBGE|nr:RNA polymerase factor sigma-54 [Rubrivivax gelatinosus]MBK1686391.1 RNA polymerase sigma-54 factor [Rubrivivax gelatinosus]TCP04385.1 RNA polymerase RpoN-/SigL-like sigma 54 subunit [Rubrivivax gelatinosus]